MYVNELFSAPSTHLGDAQPIRVRHGVVEAKREFSRFVRVEGKLLVAVRRAAGLNLAEEFTVIVHVQSAGSLRSLVESDVQVDDVLRLVEEVFNATPPVPFDEVTFARPARVRVEAVVSSVFGCAAVRTAARTGRPLVEGNGLNCYGCPLRGIDEG